VLLVPATTVTAVAGTGIGVSSVAATGLGTSVEARMQAAAGTINTAAQLGTALGVAGVLLVVAMAAGSGLPASGTKARLGRRGQPRARGRGPDHDPAPRPQGVKRTVITSPSATT
jgi:hypothetical protein